LDKELEIKDIYINVMTMLKTVRLVKHQGKGEAGEEASDHAVLLYLDVCLLM
jgi:hypothetical protein